MIGAAFSISFPGTAESDSSLCPPTHGCARAFPLLCLGAAPLLLSVFLLVGCGDQMTQSSNTTPNTGAAFVIGTDAPVASVVSFNATIQSVDAIDAGGTSVPLVSGNPMIDFARYNGLQTLMDMNNVPADTYTQIAVTFSSATIGYLQTGSGAPTIATMPATFTTSTYTQTLANPLVVSSAGPVGVRMDFRLDKSIQVSGGQITGMVTPTLDITAVGPSNPGGYIDEFIAGVVNPTLSAQSFSIQGPHGRTFTVNVNGQTEWDNGETLADLTTTSVVQISGTHRPRRLHHRRRRSRHPHAERLLRRRSDHLRPAFLRRRQRLQPVRPRHAARQRRRRHRRPDRSGRISAARRNSSSTGCTTRSRSSSSTPHRFCPASMFPWADRSRAQPMAMHSA